MKCSVIIPAHNEEKSISKCLDSLFQQDLIPDEIIVVDNASTDKTAAIVSRYKEIKMIREKRLGIIKARNSGFDSACNEIIIRTDADTILPSNFVSGIVSDFKKHKNIAGVSVPIVFYDMPFVRSLRFLFYFYMLVPRILLGHYPMTGPGMAIKKSVWKKIRKELCTDPKAVHEDIDVSIHAEKHGAIYHDGNIWVKASGRRAINKPESFFGEYTLRFFRMLFTRSF